VETLINYFYRVAQNPWWVVAIELLLIGLIVYWAVDFLEGTRGERLFRGVIFILIAGVLILNLISERSQFERIEYLFKGFLIVVLIIAVAAFQPEVRRALIKIGQPRFLAGSSQHLARTVEELVAAITYFAKTKTGAIIVIEKQVALGELVETGVRIDARVSAELLKTIFYPGTPLHDMAAIVRADRILAANVQLPLAEAGTVAGTQLGSRHRAAIGITTGSDAVCVVVSEETGTISVTEDGRLVRDLDASLLRRRLITAMHEIANPAVTSVVGKIKKHNA